MISPQDRELITSMVGSEFANDPSTEFVAEYGIRLGMLSRAGMTMHGLGPVALMQLLRDVNVKSRVAPSTIAVADWRQVPINTTIMCDGRRGQYISISGEGTLLIRLDGFKAMHEVASSSCCLTKPLVEDVDDKVFEVDADDVNIPEATKQKKKPASKSKSSKPSTIEDAKGKSGKIDKLFAMWADVEPGSEVMFMSDGVKRTATYVDLEGDDSIVVMVDDERLVLDAEQVTIPGKVKA